MHAAYTDTEALQKPCKEIKKIILNKIGTTIATSLQLSGLLKPRNVFKKLFFKLLICQKYEIASFQKIGNIFMVNERPY